MTNIEFIATYIFSNPGARYSEIMRAFHQWRKDDGWTGCRSWGSQYFSVYATASNRYKDTHWTYVEPLTPHSGYVITFKGMEYVRPEVSAFVPIGNRKR